MVDAGCGLMLADRRPHGRTGMWEQKGLVRVRAMIRRRLRARTETPMGEQYWTQAYLLDKLLQILGGHKVNYRITSQPRFGRMSHRLPRRAVRNAQMTSAGSANINVHVHRAVYPTLRNASIICATHAKCSTPTF